MQALIARRSAAFVSWRSWPTLMPTAGAFGAEAVVKMLAASRSGALRLIRPPLYREHGEFTSHRRARKRLSRSERSPATANHGSHLPPAWQRRCRAGVALSSQSAWDGLFQLTGWTFNKFV